MLTLDDPRGLIWHDADDAERIGCAVRTGAPFRVVNRLGGLPVTTEQEHFALKQARPGEAIAAVEDAQYRVLRPAW